MRGNSSIFINWSKNEPQSHPQYPQSAEGNFEKQKSLSKILPKIDSKSWFLDSSFFHHAKLSERWKIEKYSISKIVWNKTFVLCVVYPKLTPNAKHNTLNLPETILKKMFFKNISSQNQSKIENFQKFSFWVISRKNLHYVKA